MNYSEASAVAPTNKPALWTLSVKAGEIVEVSTPELHPSSALVVAKVPDTTKFDLRQRETNPFFPQPIKPDEENPGPAFVSMPARARDGRAAVFVALEDAQIWLATSGVGKKDEQFTLTVRPAAGPFPTGEQAQARLKIGKTDYWAFDAQVGDVMTLDSTARGFASELLVLDPDLTRISYVSAQPDQEDLSAHLIARKPGRYLVATSAIGHGGGGEYSLTREIFGATPFGKDAPARGELKDRQVQVWKFAMKPGEPLLVRWRSTNWSYGISVQREDGEMVSLPMTAVDDTHRFGILKVDRPTTYLIVLISRGERAEYSIELLDLLEPGR
jgi:hypothetical protein